MERLDVAPFLIEFNGLPGCGKTTIVESMFKMFNDNNIKALGIKEVYFWGENQEKTRVITMFKALFSLKYIKVNLIGIQFFSCYKFKISRIKYLLRLIKLNYQIDRVLKNKSCDLIILEEGILQYIASISHVDLENDKEILEKLLAMVLKRFEKLLIVNCNLDYESLIHRIKHRNQVGHRFDSMDENILLESLKLNLENIEKIREICKGNNCIELMMNESLSNNIEKVLRVSPLKKLKNND
jgi:nucleoside-triphosphatase THEP1